VARLFTDEDVDPLVARQLRARGYDIVSAYEQGTAAASDDAQLAYAAREDRTLLTCNVQHFVQLHVRWIRAGRDHAGIVVSRHYRRADVGEFLRLVENLLQLATESDRHNQLRYLSEFDL
jgi:hypothetical protein